MGSGLHDNLGLGSRVPDNEWEISLREVGVMRWKARGKEERRKGVGVRREGGGCLKPFNNFRLKDFPVKEQFRQKSGKEKLQLDTHTHIVCGLADERGAIMQRTMEQSATFFFCSPIRLLHKQLPLNSVTISKSVLENADSWVEKRESANLEESVNKGKFFCKDAMQPGHFFCHRIVYHKNFFTVTI